MARDKVARLSVFGGQPATAQDDQGASVQERNSASVQDGKADRAQGRKSREGLRALTVYLPPEVWTAVEVAWHEARLAGRRESKSAIVARILAKELLP